MLGWLRQLSFVTLARLKWFRRMFGGHWEKWDFKFPVGGSFWVYMGACSKDGPSPIGGFARYCCEDYSDCV